MKWIQHDTDANQDAKLQNVLLDYGLEGYGLYWYCIELIAGKISKDCITFELEHDARIIARNTGSTPQKVEEMMRYLVKEGLFESSGGVITCFKLARRLTQSMTSNPQMRVIIDGFKNHDSVMTQSDKVMQDQITLDQTREEEINPLAQPEVKPSKSELFKIAAEDAFDYFWSNMGLTKNTKIESRKEFAKAAKKANKQNAEYTPMMFAKFLAQDSTTRATNKQMGFESLGVSRYIKNERWADDHKVVASQSQAPERTQAETDQMIADVNDQYERSQASKARKLARESKS